MIDEDQFKKMGEDLVGLLEDLNKEIEKDVKAIKYNDKAEINNVECENDYKPLAIDFYKNHLLNSYKKDTIFIQTWRDILTKFIFFIICFQLILMIVLPVLNILFFKIEIDFKIIIFVVLTIFGEIIALMNIIFKYVFNSKDNKTLDIIRDYHSKMSDHEKE